VCFLCCFFSCVFFSFQRLCLIVKVELWSIQTVQYMCLKVMLLKKSIKAMSLKKPRQESRVRPTQRGRKLYDGQRKRRTRFTWDYDNTVRQDCLFLVFKNKNDQPIVFFVCLKTGTSFGMIASLFPGRERRHIKNKYNREERSHPELVTLALMNAMPMNAALPPVPASVVAASKPASKSSSTALVTEGKKKTSTSKKAKAAASKKKTAVGKKKVAAAGTGKNTINKKTAPNKKGTKKVTKKGATKKVAKKGAKKVTKKVAKKVTIDVAADGRGSRGKKPPSKRRSGRGHEI
jgi:hypothetical protein